MMFLKTPDNRVIKIEGGISIQKLDFDEDIINSNRIMDTIKSSYSNEYQSEEYSELAEEQSENQEFEQRLIEPQIAAKSEV